MASSNTPEHKLLCRNLMRLTRSSDVDELRQRLAAGYRACFEVARHALAGKPLSRRSKRPLVSSAPVASQPERFPDAVLNTLALIAAEQDTPELMQVLHDAGACIDSSNRTRVGDTVLMIAASGGNAQLVRWLLHALDDPGLLDSVQGTEAVLRACRGGNVEVMDALLSSGEGLLDRGWGGKGMTALMLAASTGKLAAVSYLLQLGPDLERESRAGQTAFAYAVKQRHADGMLVLFNAGAKVNGLSEELARRALPAAVTRGAPDLVDAILQPREDGSVCCNVNHVKDSSGHSLLLLAALRGNRTMVRVLLDHGAEHVMTGSGRGSVGLTPLVAAAGRGHLEALDEILKRIPGVAQRAVSAQGESALMQAARHGRHEAVARLLDAGADVDMRCVYGFTALLRAARSAEAKTLKLLLDAGARVDEERESHVSEAGYTPLLYAADALRHDSVRLLLQYGADVQHTSVGGDTALSLAAGVSVNTEPTMEAKRLTIELLLESGADPNRGGPYAPLLVCLEHARSYMRRQHAHELQRLVSVFVEHGADLNAQQPGLLRTPLHQLVFLVGSGNERYVVEPIKTLLRGGANPLVENASGTTVIECTFSRALRELLESWSQHLFIPLLAGMHRQQSSSLQRFASHTLFDRNVLGMVFEFVDGNPHTTDFRRNKPQP